MSACRAPPGDTVRRLVRGADRAVLATARAGDGWPYGSLVMVACDHGANPLLLLSDLAEHTKNLAFDPRASLLFDGASGLANPLAGARATVLGRLAKCEVPSLLARYVARHPDAADYLELTDFNLYRMEIERAHLVAGFGAIHWLQASDVTLDAGDFRRLAAREADIVAHMNRDHGDAVALYARSLLGLPGDGWVMTGIDPEGCDLRREGGIARLDFDRRVGDGEAARAALVGLVERARGRAREPLA